MEKKLLRSKKDRIIAGVCRGVAEYFNIDPTIVRVLFVVLTFFNGLGILLYIMLGILLPESE